MAKMKSSAVEVNCMVAQNAVVDVGVDVGVALF
jgi:hypothetical protein